MNEEFGVLKEMIPACRGQEMHKLAILQVSRRRVSCVTVDYVVLCCVGLLMFLVRIYRRV